MRSIFNPSLIFRSSENDVQLPWLVDADEFESMLFHGEFKSYENRLSLGMKIIKL